MAFYFLPKNSKVYHIGFYDDLTGRSRHLSAKTRIESEAKRLAKQKTAELRLKIRDDRLVKLNDVSFTLSKAFEFYKTQKILAEATKGIYQNSLKHFYAAAGDKPLYKYTKTDYFNLIEHLNKSNLAVNSIATYTRHLNALFGWLKKNNFIKINIIERTKEEIKDVEIISHKDLTKIFDYLNSLHDKKYYTVIKSKYLGAYRLGEIVNAKLSDYDFGNKIVNIRNTKGKRGNKIPMVKDFHSHLRASELQKKGEAYNITYSALSSFWKRMINKLYKINKDIEPELFKYKIHNKYGLHQLRKTRGTQLANAGVNPLFLQKYMRHNHFATTQQYYIKIDIDLAREDINNKIMGI